MVSQEINHQRAQLNNFLTEMDQLQSKRTNEMSFAGMDFSKIDESDITRSSLILSQIRKKPRYQSGKQDT